MKSPNDELRTQNSVALCASVYLRVPPLIPADNTEHRETQRSTEFHREPEEGTKQYVGRLPIRLPDIADASEKTLHDRLLTLVSRLLELNTKKNAKSLAPSELTRLDREVATTDAAIDDLVFALYGITDKERAVIEGQTA